MISMQLPGLFWTLVALQIAGVALAFAMRIAEGAVLHRALQRAFFVFFVLSGSCAICAFWWGATVGILHGFVLAVMTVAAIFDTRITRPDAEPTW